MTKQPRKQQTFTFQVEEGTLAALDALRRNEPDIPTRGKMICRLIEQAAQQAAKS